MNAEHALVAGPSGGGKTTFLRELHARHDGHSVFLSTKSGETARHNPPNRILRSPARYPADVSKIREWAANRSGVTQVIVDEAQNAPSFKSGDGPLANGLHEDRSRGIKWVVATQNPMDLRSNDRGYGPIQQCEYWVWVGPLRNWHEGFFDANHMAKIKQLLPASDYEYVVIDPTASRLASEQIVYEGRTKEAFTE